MKSGEILLEWTWNEVAATLGWDGLVAMNRETKRVLQHGFVATQ